MKPSFAVVATTLFFAPFSMQSQVIQFDSTSARIARDIRTGRVVEIGTILMQENGVSRQTKSAIADSAASIVLGSSANSVTQPARARLISELGVAARSTTSGAKIAFDALRRIGIHAKSEEDGVRAAGQLMRTLDVSAALEVLVEIAALPDNRAAVAIDGLWAERLADTGGLAALQRLWEGALVSNRSACEGLRQIAYLYKWKATAQTSCR